MITKSPAKEYELKPEPISVGLFIDDNTEEESIF